MSFQKFTLVICLVLSIGTLVGCQPESGGTHSKSNDDHHGPGHNLKLHKPKTLSAAVNRLAAINESLGSPEPFPQPLKIDYVEVIHGSGPGGHSHFYPASSYDAKHEDGDAPHDSHSEDDETVKRLVAEIPLRTELTDTVKWLPDVAAKSNASEADWTTVSNTAKSLTAILGGIAKDATDDDFRDAWKQQSNEIEPLLTTLKTLATKTMGASK